MISDNMPTAMIPLC